MTGRERLVAAARGGETDRPASLAEDAVIVPEPDAVTTDDGRAMLVEVLNPYGEALTLGLDPQDPEVVADMAASTRENLNDALESGADGVFYRLHGATKDTYGPYREHDRALLAEIADARLNVVAPVPPFDLEFLRDIPAHLFAWPAQTPQPSFPLPLIPSP